MKVEIWSDVICPFCYIGKKHFEIAINELSFKDKIDVVWKSFQLDPNLPDKGLDISTIEYLEQRKGMQAEHVLNMLSHLKSKGNEVGIDFRQDISIQANTFKAHRLLHFAQNKSKANDLEELLFKAHFSDGKNIADNNTLLDLATSIGLNSSEVENFLQSSELSDEVRADIQEAQDLGISGVPFFVINRKYGISGAQPIEIFINTLKEAFREGNNNFEMKGNDSSGVCEDDSCEI
ncbi:MAG TPA: DsbA family oxidoreductase [Candidatus Kapabacteria bacterium]|nr:DsbA family oxidoreductase [Candidatus Kapabacteria bacterium]